MSYRVKIGMEGCYLVHDCFDISADGIESSKRLLSRLDWHDDKIIVVVFNDEPSPGRTTYSVRHQSLSKISPIRSFVIGQVPLHLKDYLAPFVHFEKADHFLTYIDSHPIQNALIAIKGNSSSVLRVSRSFEQKSATSVLEIDIDAVLHNLRYYKSHLSPATKVMVMLKAFAYGNGHIEIARILQGGADYFGVAYIEEGIELRKKNIKTPIAVMNVYPGDFENLMLYKLEPSIATYDMLHLLDSFIKTKRAKKIQIHLKIDTGMNRLGFKKENLPLMINALKRQQKLVVKSIFSHLACADDETQDGFTMSQFQNFEKIAMFISRELNIRPALHILNSSGISRFSNFQFDMVRLGIGLYGIDNHGRNQSNLKNISTLKTRITQIKKVMPGETVGYGRHHQVTGSEMQIAIIAIGYADGFSRLLSRGKGEVLVQERRVPVIGNICMDMAMIDVSEVSAKEGDVVTIFNDHLTIQEISSWLGTIPYEILTGIGERVNREFVGQVSQPAI